MPGLRNPAALAWLYLMRVTDRIQHNSMQHLAQFDLTPAQFDVLAHLSAKGGITQQALSERLLVTKGNVCGLIDRLESHGLVQRRPDADDRRSNLLFLTPAGEQLAATVVPDHEDFIQEQLAGLSAEEQRALHKLLRDLDRSLVQRFAAHHGHTN